MFAACVPLDKSCNGFYETIKKNQDQHATVQGLPKDIKALKGTVTTLATDLQTESLSKAITARQHRYWPDVKRVIEYAKSMVDKLNGLLKSGPRNVFRTKDKYFSIEACRSELFFSRRCLQLSHHVIMMYCPYIL